MPKIDVITAPAVAVLTVADVKSFLRFEINADDDLIADLIETATTHCEKYCNRPFITTTYRIQRLNDSTELVLNKGGFQSIVQVIDGDDEEVSYVLDDTGAFARVLPTDFSVGSSTSPTRLIVDWKAGFGDAASDVPYNVKHAVKVATAYLWRYREDPEKIPSAVYHLLNEYRVRGVA